MGCRQRQKGRRQDIPWEWKDMKSQRATGPGSKMVKGRTAVWRREQDLGVRQRERPGQRAAGPISGLFGETGLKWVSKRNLDLDRKRRMFWAEGTSQN